jgi:hypothetical protein
MDEPALKIDTGMAENREVRCAIYPWMALLNVYRREPWVNSFFVKFTCICGGTGAQCGFAITYLFSFVYRPQVTRVAWCLGSFMQSIVLRASGKGTTTVNGRKASERKMTLRMTQELADYPRKVADFKIFPDIRPSSCGQECGTEWLRPNGKRQAGRFPQGLR